MKIEAKKLVEFFNRFEDVNTETLLVFGEQGVTAKTMSPSNIVRLDIFLTKNVFSEYSPIGKIGVGDINVLKRIVERFGGPISLIVEGNLLTIKGEGKKVETELIDPQFITEVTELPELKFDQTFFVDTEKVSGFIADATINRGVVYSLLCKDKLLVLECDGKFKFQHTIPTENCVGGTTVKLGESFPQIIKNISGVVEFSLSTDYPIKILEKTEEMTATYIIAPRIKPAEEENE
jgi:hypothetical protein